MPRLLKPSSITPTVLNSTIITALSLALVTSPVSAKEEKYSYPVLMVTPKASDRLEMEARKEKKLKWTSFLPIQLSGLMTFTTSLIQRQDVNTDEDASKHSSLAGALVGGGWVITGTALMAFYRPYRRSYSKNRKLPSGTKREQLHKERLAEEALKRPADLAEKLMWLSVITNAGASAYMYFMAEQKTFGRTLSAISVAAAFVPLMFQSRWIKTYDTHEKYKKRIYGPVANITPALFESSTSAHYGAGLSLNLRF